MKALLEEDLIKEKEPKFKPVALILETQEEVNGVFSLVNCGTLRHTAGFEFGTFKHLDPYADHTACTKLGIRLRALLK